MTLADLLPGHRTVAPATPHAVPATAANLTLVYLVPHRRRWVAHRIRGGCTGCHQVAPLYPDRMVPLQAAIRQDAHWCDQCWTGRRCLTCRRPSGEARECGECTAGAVDEDKAIERRAA